MEFKQAHRLENLHVSGTRVVFSKCAELAAQHIPVTALPLGAFAVLMQPIHLAIGLVEGLITAAGCRCASRVCRNCESCIAGLHTV